LAKAPSPASQICCAESCTSPAVLGGAVALAVFLAVMAYFLLEVKKRLIPHAKPCGQHLLGGSF
jgi:hypothetical protein